MSDGKKYYCFCSSNCKYETMTKEQILAAIAQAVQTGSVGDCDTGFITKIKEKNGGKCVTFWVGTQAQYNAIESKEQNCMYIITDDTLGNDLKNLVTVKHEHSDGMLVRWFSDGFAECWVNYRIPNVTTPHEKGGLYLSSRFDLPMPDIYKNTHYYAGPPTLCEGVLVGMETDDTSPLLLFSAGSSDQYKSDMRFYIGTTRQITEETRVHVKLHIVWRYKTA